MPRSRPNTRTPPRRSPPAPAPNGAQPPAPDAALPARFAAALKALRFSSGAPAVVALSGGGDSVALLLLLKAWADSHGAAAPQALIVDHGLRGGSAGEAADVAQWAQRTGIAAEVLTWRGRKPEADIENAAREARYRLMGAWCVARGVRQLFVAHSEDDQAETFLLRLGRGSGVDGLAAMQPRAPYPLAGFDVALLRPLLSFTRAELRAFAASQGVAWREDPMNDDPRFARVRIRRLLPELERAGLAPSRIAAAAAHLARAREALDDAADALLRDRAVRDAGCFRIDLAALLAAPEEIGLRALARALMQVSEQPYRPRFERLQRLYNALHGEGCGRARTLHGCRIARAARENRVFGSLTLEIRRETPRTQRSQVQKASETAHSAARI